MEAGAATAPQEATRARATTKKKARDRSKVPWWMWFVVVAIVVFCLFPFYWLVNISLKTGNDLLSSSLFPPHPTLKNYQEIFKNPDFTKALRNSAVVALSTTALALAVGSFCAYALARLKLRGKFLILAIVLTQGQNGTSTLSTIAQETFATNRIYGLGSAMAVLTFIIVMIVSFSYIRFVGGNLRGLAEE